MKLGILKKHRNTLFEILNKSKLELSYFDSEYTEDKNEFKIFIRDHDFKFEISREDDSLEYFISIQGDTLREDDAIDTDGEFDVVIESFKTWLEVSAAEYISILKDEKFTPDYWETIKDPITKKYQEEFYTEFESVDKDADTEPFNLKQQIFLDGYLEKIIKEIGKFKTKENAEIIEEIKQNSKDLKEEISKLTKKETVRKLSTIWAKMRKAGLAILKEFYIVAKEEIIKAILKATIGLPG